MTTTLVIIVFLVLSVVLILTLCGHSVNAALKFLGLGLSIETKHRLK
jgi:hypothetical protein